MFIIVCSSVESKKFLTIMEAKMGQNGRRSTCATLYLNVCVIAVGNSSKPNNDRKTSISVSFGTNSLNKFLVFIACIFEYNPCMNITLTENCSICLGAQQIHL